MATMIDRTGNTYGKLTVLSFAYTQNNKKYWNCACECGNKTTVRGDALLRGSVLTCGGTKCKKNINESTRSASQVLAREIKENTRALYKEKVLEHYGTCCAYCGSTEKLTIDHISGNGAAHRDEVGRNLYKWLIDNNFPAGYQTLCDYHNRMKGERTHDGFIEEMIILLSRHGYTVKGE